MNKYLFNTIFVLLFANVLKAQNPVAAFSGSTLSGCAPLSVAFRDESTGTPKFWDWEFTGPSGSSLNNQQNPTVTFSQPGTYTITLVVRNANGVNAITKTDYITVFPSPSVGFSADITTACIPAGIQFTGNVSTPVGSITSVEWNFGDGSPVSGQNNPRHIYTQTGYYTVMLTATSSNNCIGRAVAGRFIRMVGGIEADFIAPPSAECRPPFNVNFRNESTGPGTLTYEWDLGNGNTSTDLNPITSYNSSTSYNVRLITRSSFGCIDTTVKQVNVTSYTTDFNVADTVCIGQNINLQNISGTDVVSYRWDFGDGNSSLQLNPSKSYNTAGLYQVKLFNQFASCADSITKTVVVTDKPVVNFTAANNAGCAVPLIANFQNNTPGTTVMQWDFGDGNTSAEQTPAHQYNRTGEFNVTLTAVTSYGCQSTTTQNSVVRIIPPTVSIVNPNSRGCRPLTVSPTANITSIDGVAAYDWDMGNGVTGNSATAPSATYGTAGIYTIRLIITTNGGCKDTATSTVNVGDPPANVDFTFTPGGLCVSDTSSFEGTATNANEWQWDFGDGGTSNLQNPKYIYQDTGRFTVTLTALNNGCGALPVEKTQIIEKQAPVAKFGFMLDCNDRRVVSFTDSSIVDPALSVPVYEWDFGDGPVSNTVGSTTHTFSNFGNYTVRLRVENGSCFSIYEVPVTVAPLDSTFTLSESAICRNERVTITANEADANVERYRWTIAGGTAFEAGKMLDTTFNSLGNFPVRLEVSDQYGCVATSAQTIIVTGPVAQFAPAAAAVCKNGTVNFTDQSTSDVGIASWTWDFGDGHTQTFNSATAVSHQYTDTGTFVVKLLVRDNAQCTNEFISQDTIRVTSPLAAFNMPAKYCPGIDVPFTNNSEGYNLTYQWNFGDGQNSTDVNPVHSYSDGTYDVKLVITDDTGCRDSVAKPGIQIVKPVAAFDVIDSTSICQVLETRFPFRGQHYESVLWDFGDGNTSVRDSTARNFYADYGSYTVKLYAYGFGGCVDSASSVVNVYNPNVYTQINYTVPPAICNEITVTFDVTVPPNTKFYFYFDDGTLDSSGQTSLTHTYTYPRADQSAYRPSVYLIDSSDCRVSIGRGSINIYGAVPVFNLDRRAFCDSGTVFLTNYSISNDGIASQVWNFGDGQTFSGKDPQPHTFTQAGLYPVELTVTTDRGCVKTFTDTVRVPRTPAPIITNDLLTCVDRMVMFNGQLAQPDTAIRWAWNFGDGRTSTEQNNNITYDKPGSYNIQLSAANFLGCSASTSQTFTVAPLPVINIQDITIPVGAQVQLPVTYSPGTALYHWAPPEGLSCTSCPNPVASPQFTKTYQLLVTDSNTCVSSGQITVNVLCSQENYFVPNTFSPNGDGVNEIFYPRGKGLARVQSMKVFNRWGQLVFDRRNFMANDASMGWNGKAAGQAVPPDVYVYIIEFVCDNAQIVPMKGNVTLVR